MSTTRKQVMAQIITVMAEAKARGEDPYRAAERAFPGTPGIVLCEAEDELDHQRTEAWWRTIERTIDGEVIRNAIAGTPAEPVDAGPREAELDAAFDALVRADGSTAAPH